MAAISDEVNRLLARLFESSSLLDRLRGADPRRDILAQIAASREFRVVPALLTILARNDSLSPHAARAIAALVHGAGPADVAWLDEQARSGAYMFSHDDAWWTLAPDGVARLAATAGFDPAILGLLASHRNGYVRAAAVERLGAVTTGQEIPFLTLRANDWVPSVAAAASALLLQRLQPENRRTVIDALPFIVRMLGQRRRDHSAVVRTVASVLLSDGGDEVLARAAGLELRVRRVLYELLAAKERPDLRVLKAALTDADAVIRTRALKRVTSVRGSDELTLLLERLVREDPVPVVRKQVLTVLSERVPERMADVVPAAVGDRSAGVRELARFLVTTHDLPLVPRDAYIARLTSTAPRQLAAAIEGIGETGRRTDLDLLIPFLSSGVPRVRRAALRACARLDVERSIPLSVAALTDEAPSVRKRAVRILAIHSSHVDFAIVGELWHNLTDARARRDVLPLLRHAPKWDAAAFLLNALTDPHEDVRTSASRLLDSWVANFNRRQTLPRPDQLQRIRQLLNSVTPRMSAATAKLLRFSIKDA